MRVFDKNADDALIAGHDQLMQKKDEFEKLIKKCKALKERTLSLLIITREEVASLSKLAPTYPTSQKIHQRMQDLDKIIEQGVDALTSINENLSTYATQLKAIEQRLKPKNDTSTQSTVKP